MVGKVYLNGEFVDKERAVVSVEDRGLLFADGIYEVIRVYEGALFQCAAHLDRMCYGARELEIEPPLDRPGLEGMFRRLVEANGCRNGSLYMQLTRGVAPRNHLFPEGARPTLFAFTQEVAKSADLAHPPQPAPAITAPDNRWGICYIKTVGLLPNVLARQQAQREGAREALLVRDGLVTEGTSSNVFVVSGGTLYTHPLANILPGITRRVVLDLAARAGIAAREEAVPLQHLRRADEVFITGTMTELQPIVAVDGHEVGDGRPGPTWARLYEAFRRLVAREHGVPA